VDRSGQGFLIDIALGIVGAIVGGALLSFFGAAGVAGLNIDSLVVAVIGAIVVQWLYHLIAEFWLGNSLLRIREPDTDVGRNDRH
jgi:uncharacterized membrane protein YeaQ/YmgE (transglycosylase-associated protein family)